MSKYVVKKKQGKALWARTFPSQAAALHPERGAAGGVKWRSKSKEVLDAVYNAIAALFKTAHPTCRICELRGNVPRWTDDVHHSRGREGLLLFDVRYFIAACRTCHTWAEDNKEAARALGVTAQRGDWDKEEI
jgi:hypothetical protein